MAVYLLERIAPDRRVGSRPRRGAVMRTALKGLGYNLLLIAVFLGTLYAVTVWREHHTGPAAIAVAGPDPAQLDFQHKQAAFAAELARLDAAHGCMDPDTWTKWRARIHSYPVHMVVQPVTAAGLPTWDLVVKPWSMANVGGYVKGLCLR